MTSFIMVLGVAALVGLLFENMDRRREISSLKRDMRWRVEEIDSHRKAIWDLREREAIALSHFNLEYHAHPRSMTLVEKKK